MQTFLLLNSVECKLNKNRYKKISYYLFISNKAEKMFFLKSVFFPFNIKNIKEILLGPYSPRSRTIFMEEIKKKCYLLYLLPGNI